MLGNPMGGQLLNWMDIASAISANRHCRRVVVTAAVNNVSFDQPIHSATVTIEAKVSRAFTSSMEVFMESSSRQCHRQALQEQRGHVHLRRRRPAWRAHHGAELVPESEEEHAIKGALRRRQLRLILAGKMKPADATELKALFD